MYNKSNSDASPSDESNPELTDISRLSLAERRALFPRGTAIRHKHTGQLAYVLRFWKDGCTTVVLHTGGIKVIASVLIGRMWLTEEPPPPPLGPPPGVTQLSFLDDAA